MTIKGLWAYVQKNAIDCMSTIPQDSFAGHRVAIDMMGFCFSIMMNARSKVSKTWNVAKESISQEAVNVVFYRLFIDSVISLLEKDITPIFVFEFGRHHLKTRVDAKRELDRQHTLLRIEQLREELNEDMFSKNNYRKVEELRTLEAQYKAFPAAVKETLFEFLIHVGIPCVRGKDGVEAERIASILCSEGIAIAVYSPDGDCLAHAAPIQIKGHGSPIFENGFGKESFVVVDREMLLDILDVTSEQFTDLCICSECDYNTNMRLIGFAKSLSLVKQYGGVQGFPSKFDTKCLLYDKCLPEFGYDTPEVLLAEECIEYYGITKWEEATFTVKIKEISSAFEKLNLESRENDFKHKVSCLAEPVSYHHREEVVSVINGENFTTVKINFPEGGIPYEKPVKKQAYSRKAPIQEREDAPVQRRKAVVGVKIDTLIGDIEEI